MDHYHVEQAEDGCEHCGAGVGWMVVDADGDDALGTVYYGDTGKEGAEEIAEDMNAAFNEGRRLWRDPSAPRIVCLCGSSRFAAERAAAAMAETLAGRIVVGMGCFGHADYPPGARAATSDGDESTEVKRRLDALHLAKIDLADDVLILNVGGYVGDSTKREIAYARAHGKPVRWLEDPRDPDALLG